MASRTASTHQNTTFEPPVGRTGPAGLRPLLLPAGMSVIVALFALLT